MKSNSPEWFRVVKKHRQSCRNIKRLFYGVHGSDLSDKRKHKIGKWEREALRMARKMNEAV